MYNANAVMRLAWPRFLLGGEMGMEPATFWQLFGNFFCGEGGGLETGNAGNDCFLGGGMGGEGK